MGKFGVNEKVQEARNRKADAKKSSQQADAKKKVSGVRMRRASVDHQGYSPPMSGLPLYCS